MMTLLWQCGSKCKRPHRCDGIKSWLSVIWFRKCERSSPTPMLIRRYFQFSCDVKRSSVVVDDDDKIHFLLRGWMDSFCVYTHSILQIFSRKHNFYKNFLPVRSPLLPSLLCSIKMALNFNWIEFDLKKCLSMDAFFGRVLLLCRTRR